MRRRDASHRQPDRLALSRTPAMTTAQTPELDLAAILATKAFDEEDLAHNRRGVLSPAQEAWRAEHPVFMDEDGEHDGAVETLVGRVAIEGRYVAGGMGETSFAKLVLHGRRLSLRQGLKRSLVRDAPYRAYAAYGWIWSIEPISEDELRAATSAVATYRSSEHPTGEDHIARELQAALSRELSFEEGDLVANMGGGFSPAQRATGLKKLLSATFGLVISSAALLGLVSVLDTGTPFPVFATFFAIVGLGGGWIMSARSLADALARLIHPKPLCVVARLDNDPTNRENVVLASDDRRRKIKRAAVAIAGAPFSVLRAWRFEVYVLPWTGSVVSVRPVPPT
jgi:hypothetical protein